ncbi:MAG: DUF58 domain-containing protein, partial [Actinomycetota bacterium]|nr:DUF58 domain-containing protein [Actinomycetota bacterium]
MTTDPSPPKAAGSRPDRSPPPSTLQRDPRTLVYKELRPRGSAAGAGALALLGWSIWSQTGSRLTLFVCAASLALLVLDLVWSQVATAKAQVDVRANPAEAVVGDTVTFQFSVRGPRQFLRLSLVSFQGTKGEVGMDAPTTRPQSGTATAREVATAVVVEIVSNGIAGLVGCGRRRAVPLHRPLAVGPRPIPGDLPFPELFHIWGEGEPRPAPTGDLVRGVRAYLPGDPLRRVHWRATARAGDLVVKEVEDTTAARLHLVLDLGGGGVAGERAAGRAAWYAGEALRRGYAVVLATAERQKEVIAPVQTPSDVNRRLAAAALPGHPSVPADVGEPVLVVTDRGDT